MNYWTCPVCSYPGLTREPKDHLICPCCLVRFSYDDCTTSHAELRRKWIERGCRWHSRHTLQPHGWDAMDQLSPVEQEWHAALVLVNCRKVFYSAMALGEEGSASTAFERLYALAQRFIGLAQQDAAPAEQAVTVSPEVEQLVRATYGLGDDIEITYVKAEPQIDLRDFDDDVPSSSSVLTPEEAAPLTSVEQQVMEGLVAAWNAFVTLESESDDKTDFRRAIHEAQRIIFTRVYTRLTTTKGG